LAAAAAADDSHSTRFHSQGAFEQLACDSGGVDVITAIINTLFFAHPDFTFKHKEGLSSGDVLEKSCFDDQTDSLLRILKNKYNIMRSSDFTLSMYIG
jgi:hypothetical protein